MPVSPLRRVHSIARLATFSIKWADAEIDRGLRYLSTRFKDADAWQISATGTRDYQSPEGIRVAPALDFLRTLV